MGVKRVTEGERRTDAARRGCGDEVRPSEERADEAETRNVWQSTRGQLGRVGRALDPDSGLFLLLCRAGRACC